MGRPSRGNPLDTVIGTSISNFQAHEDPRGKMDQPISTRPFRANLRPGDKSVFHFMRFLEAFTAPIADPIGNECAHKVQRNANFRILHVKRTLAEPADVTPASPALKILLSRSISLSPPLSVK